MIIKCGEVMTFSYGGSDFSMFLRSVTFHFPEKDLSSFGHVTEVLGFLVNDCNDGINEPSPIFTFCVKINQIKSSSTDNIICFGNKLKILDSSLIRNEHKITVA